MKSVLVVNDFATTLTKDEVATLKRGQAALVNSAGKVISSYEDVKDGQMMQLVVGLGDGKVKRGVWLNPANLKSHKEEYSEPKGKTYSFTNLKAGFGVGYKGFDAEVVISCKPLNSFGGYPLEVFVASVTMASIDETSDEIITRLKSEVEKKLAEINARFGKDSVTIDDFTSENSKFTGKAGFEFYVRLDGILSGTLKEGEENITPVGTYEQVALLEKEAAVADMGYNPNFKEYDRVYGDIFTAEEGVKYDTYVFTSEADYTHPLHVHTEGLRVTQFVAFDNSKTEEIGNFETALGLSE